LLYKVASLIHADPASVLSGGSGIGSPAHGRFHVSHQRVTYCSDNVLVAIAEVLSAMHARVMQRLRERAPVNVIRATIREERSLVIPPVRKLERLAYLESAALRRELGVFGGSFIVSAERQEHVFHEIANKLRQQDCNGIMYPSARHSRGHAIALFTDQTSSLKTDSFAALRMTLQLVPEDFDLATPRMPDPFEEVIDSSRGYYAFTDEPQFTALESLGRLSPQGLSQQGTVDLFRKAYRRYPYDAVGGRPDDRPKCPIMADHCPYRTDS
jgi:hypothetical protein